MSNFHITPPQPHSKKRARDWVTQAHGHAPATDLLNPAHMARALDNPESLVLADPKQVTQSDLERVHGASGLLVQPGALKKLASNLDGQQRTRAILDAKGLDAFQAEIRTFGGSDPRTLVSTIPAAPPPTKHGNPTPLPVPHFGQSGGRGGVRGGQPPSGVVVGQTTAVPPPPLVPPAQPPGSVAPPVTEQDKLAKKRADNRRRAVASRARKRNRESDDERRARLLKESERNRDKYKKRKGGDM